jgi:hypothetical protein
LRAKDARERALTRRLASLAIGMLASRRSTAAIVGSEPAWAMPWTLPSAAVSSDFASVHSHVPLVVAGGRVFPGASRELLARQRAGRRSRPAYAMPRESTLSGRDRESMGTSTIAVKDKIPNISRTASIAVAICWHRGVLIAVAMARASMDARSQAAELELVGDRTRRAD